MRCLLAIFVVGFHSIFASTAFGQELLEDFEARIQAALAIANEDARFNAVEQLFYRGNLDAWAEELAKTTPEYVARLQSRNITFEPLASDSNFEHVVDGYEYFPNLIPLGYVVFTDPQAVPGNNTKAPYGLIPSEQVYAMPLTIRRLVNPDAAPDKQLQMLAMGVGHPAATFEGWCDVALSNNTIRRIILDDQGIGNQTRILRGQRIEACEVINTSDYGSLSLRLFEDDETLLERNIEIPDTTITYQAP